MMVSTEHKKFKCLICNVPCFELEIDKLQQSIIEKIKEKRLQISELIFDNEVLKK